MCGACSGTALIWKLDAIKKGIYYDIKQLINDEAMTTAAMGTSKNNSFNEQNNNSARASRFLVHFFAFTRREMTKF